MKEKQINIRITEDVKKRLESKSSKFGMNVSQYVRYIVMKDLEEK
jgi:predicted DNA binding CopG/RHH family protein